jgi:predicted small metal-binding protein
MRGETEAEVMSAVAEHARADHGIETVPAELATKVRSMIVDLPAA